MRSERRLRVSDSFLSVKICWEPILPSSIEWTDETWNPVTGCTRVSPGCDHCYMYALYPRLKGMNVRGYETGPEDVRLLPERLQAPLTWKKPRRVFVNNLSSELEGGWQKCQVIDGEM